MVTDKLQVSNSGTDIFVQGIFFPAILSARYPKNCQDISSFLIGKIAPSLSGEDGPYLLRDLLVFRSHG